MRFARQAVTAMLAFFALDKACVLQVQQNLFKILTGNRAGSRDIRYLSPLVPGVAPNQIGQRLHRIFGGMSQSHGEQSTTLISRAAPAAKPLAFCYTAYAQIKG